MKIDLPIGAHIKSSRVLYAHHGIYIGNGEVIHYSGLANDLKNEGKIEKISLSEFANGHTIELIQYPTDKVLYSPDEIVQRAKSKLGENAYDLIQNNCEHFACWCVTGKSVSHQVKTAVVGLTAVYLTSALVRLFKKYNKKDNEKSASH